MTRLNRGDYVRVRLNDRDEWTRAFVGLASNTDPSSVMLLFDGAVRTSEGGLISGVLPLTVDYAQQNASSPFGDVYQIEVAS